MQTDYRCENCQQMVAPKRTTKPIIWQLALLAFLVANPLFVLAGGPRLSGLEWLFIAAVGPSIVLLVAGRRASTARCPICKTTNLQPPADAQS